MLAKDSISSVIVKLGDDTARYLPVINDDNSAIGVITQRDIATIKSFAYNANGSSFHDE